MLSIWIFLGVFIVFVMTYLFSLIPHHWVCEAFLFALTLLFIILKNDPHQALAISGFVLLLGGGLVGNMVGILLGCDLNKTAQIGSLVSFWMCMFLIAIAIKIDVL